MEKKLSVAIDARPAAVYAALGFDGLHHYHLAPASAHSAMMNFTIWFEVVTAAILLAVLALQWKRS